MYLYKFCVLVCLSVCTRMIQVILIGYRAEGRVRHCRIQVENNQYMIGSATFDSLTELVQYYESNPLYRRMKLKYAINDEVLKSIGEVGAKSVAVGVAVGVAILYSTCTLCT